jgi:hypothetical protein
VPHQPVDVPRALPGDGPELPRLFWGGLGALEEAAASGKRALGLAEAAGAAMEASQACEILALANFPLGNWEEGLAYELRRSAGDWSPEIAVAVDAHL